MYDLIIIGGGAAGLACAIRLKQLNGSASVLIAEAAERLGKKIAATGNGQGNLSNTDMSPSHYHGSAAALAAKIIADKNCNPITLFDFITVSDRLGRIYPASKQASAISDCLIRKVSVSGAEVAYNSPATSISVCGDGTFKVICGGKSYCGRTVLIACGGEAQKQFKTDGASFALAASLGHSVSPLYPSLVQLKCNGGFKALKGIRADCVVSVMQNGKKIFTTAGDVIFTDYGLSGNAIFCASAYCAGRENISLEIEFVPDISVGEIERVISLRQSLGYPFSELLGGTLHNSLGRELARRCKIHSAENLAKLVKCFSVEVTGSLGWDYAQVTKGGIKKSEVGEDLQSRLCKNLYFAGEVLDVDGDCGGYNLHFAFASGMYAAANIAKNLAPIAE